MYRAAHAAAAVAVFVCAGSTAYAQEIYATGGTLGLGLGGGINLGPHLGVRADAQGLAFGRSFTVDDNRYDGHLSLAQGGLYMDVFPFTSSAFRVTGGALINSDTLTATAVPNADGNYKIGNDYVPAVGGAPTAKASFPHVMPYLGIGYGHKKPERGLGVSFDLGVAYGRPHVSYEVPEIYQLFVGPDDIQDEEQKLTAEADKFRWYPVAQVALTYRF
jgi:hypothetical protein